MPPALAIGQQVPLAGGVSVTLVDIDGNAMIEVPTETTARVAIDAHAVVEVAHLRPLQRLTVGDATFVLVPPGGVVVRPADGPAAKQARLTALLPPAEAEAPVVALRRRLATAGRAGVQAPAPQGGRRRGLMLAGTMVVAVVGAAMALPSLQEQDGGAATVTATVAVPAPAQSAGSVTAQAADPSAAPVRTATPTSSAARETARTSAPAAASALVDSAATATPSVPPAEVPVAAPAEAQAAASNEAPTAAQAETSTEATASAPSKPVASPTDAADAAAPAADAAAAEHAPTEPAPAVRPAPTTAPAPKVRAASPQRPVRRSSGPRSPSRSGSEAVAAAPTESPAKTAAVRAQIDSLQLEAGFDPQGARAKLAKLRDGLAKGSALRRDVDTAIKSIRD
jgi:hypothetical protein